MKTLTEWFEEILQDLSGCSFESPPLYMEESFRKAVKEFLIDKRKEQETLVLIHSNKVNRQLMIDDLIQDCEKEGQKP
jgi:hypothetical protein